MTDDVLETRLRQHFVDRMPAEASPRLRDRLAGIPMDAAKAPRRPWLRLAGAAAAGLVTVAIAVALVRVASVERGPGVLGGPPLTPSISPPMLVPGDGVTTPSVALSFWLLAAVVVVVLVLVFKLLASRRLPRWAEGVVLVALTLAASGGTRGVMTGADLVDQGSFAPGPGWVEPSSTTGGFGEMTRDGAFMPGPNGSFSFALPITNNGSLPVTIHGLAIRGAAESGTVVASLVALGSPEPGQTWTGALMPGPDGVAPWQPVTLWPGEAAVLSVLGVGGPCAAAPGDQAVGGTSGFASIPLVVDVAGFGYVEDVPITVVDVATTESCPPS